MPDTNDLVRAIKQAAMDAVQAAKPMNLLYGTVVSASPLQIQTEQKIILDADQLIVPESLTDHKVQVQVSWETGSKSGGSGESSFSAHTHTVSGKKIMTVLNGLKAGDKVILIRQQSGQTFFVCDRIGG